MSAHAVNKWIFILLSYEFCEPVCRPVETQKREFSGQGCKMSLVLQTFLFLPGGWCAWHP